MSESKIILDNRIKDVTVIKPIVYGNVSRYLGKKLENGHTHQWTVFIKPYENNCLSSFVKKVVFRLHNDYPKPDRCIVEPPYEVTETGWGEFEVLIKVYFHSVIEKPVTISHILKLYNLDPDIISGKKSLFVEKYDELIFQQPCSSLYRLLMLEKRVTCGEYRHQVDIEAVKKLDFNLLNGVHQQIKENLNAIRENKLLSVQVIQILQEEAEKESNINID